MRVKDAVGRYGEQLAADHLTAAGCEILARNWRCPDGELDIVALDGDELAFVEVKTRSSELFGSPAEAVDRVKAARIRQLAVRWMHGYCSATGRRPWTSLRFDVIAIVRGPGGPRLDHLRGAF